MKFHFAIWTIIAVLINREVDALHAAAKKP